MSLLNHINRMVAHNGRTRRAMAGLFGKWGIEMIRNNARINGLFVIRHGCNYARNNCIVTNELSSASINYQIEQL